MKKLILRRFKKYAWNIAVLIALCVGYGVNSHNDNRDSDSVQMSIIASGSFGGIVNDLGLKTIGKCAGIGVVGMGVDCWADHIDKKGGSDASSKFLHTTSSTLEYASVGAMVGSAVPAIGTLIGGCVGGVIGAGTGIYSNYTSAGRIAKTKDKIKRINAAHGYGDGSSDDGMSVSWLLIIFIVSACVYVFRSINALKVSNAQQFIEGKYQDEDDVYDEEEEKNDDENEEEGYVTYGKEGD